MIRSLFTGIAAFALMSGVAFAQPDRDDSARGGEVVVHAHANPAVHIVRGGAIGAGVGALIGCLVTLPVCGPGAGVGAAIGGGTGGVVGAVNTPTHDYTYRTSRNDYPPPD